MIILGRKIIRCARCNAKLKYPVWIDEKPYGSTCATYVQPKIDYRAEITSLRQQVRDLQIEIKKLKTNTQINETPSSPPIESSTNPLGMNYGCDHGELMIELRAVLKERILC